MNSRQRWILAFATALASSQIAAGGCGNINNDDVTIALTRLVSKSTDGRLSNQFSSDASISGNGRFVAFRSFGTTLHPDDTDFFSDIYVRDLETNETTLVSRATGSSGAKGNADSSNPSISENGQFVAFESNATNLDPDDLDGTSDIFVRDLVNHTTVLVSRATGSGVKGNAASSLPDISADGQFVAFQSAASNLAGADANGFFDIYRRELTGAKTTVRVSFDTGGGDPDAACTNCSISANGNFIAFDSTATDLVVGDTNGQQDVFRRDVAGAVTVRVSLTSAGAEATGGGSRIPAISATGQFVAFESDATNLVTGDTNGDRDIFRRDIAGGTTVRVSVNSAGAEADGFSREPSISSDGSRIVFTSFAPNLVDGDTNGTGDVFIRDVTAGTTFRISVATFGGEADNFSEGGDISPDGKFAAFQSFSSVLVQGDTNGQTDIFLRGPIE